MSLYNLLYNPASFALFHEDCSSTINAWPACINHSSIGISEIHFCLFSSRKAPKVIEEVIYENNFPHPNKFALLDTFNVSPPALPILISQSNMSVWTPYAPGSYRMTSLIFLSPILKSYNLPTYASPKRSFSLF